MTNADKYLKDGVDSYTLYEEFDNFCLREMVRHDKGSFKAFMGQSVKPTLTEDEKVILRNTNKKYTLIGRKNGDTTLYMQDSDGECYERIFLYAFDHLFQFIKPRRRI